ncbi:hypothetical protein L9F63_022237, partial [Diploptera punctata]
FISNLRKMKPLDANSYATKKTIAQGMLDIALLTANASQLKYVLQVGHQHEFYTLMVWLISISIILQVCVGVIFLVIGGLDINKHKDQRAAVILNDVTLIMVFVISLINVIVSGFGMEHSGTRLKEVERFVSGILAIILSTLNINDPDKQLLAAKLNHAALGFVMGSMVSDACQGVIYVMLGSAYNINKNKDHTPANIWNNFVLALGIVTTIINVIISAFDMRETDKIYDDSVVT